MPQFIMPISNIADWNELDAFTQGYIEAIFFVESDPSITIDEWKPGHEFIDGSFPDDCETDHIHPESLSKIVQDCAQFQKDNAALLARAYDHDSGYDETQAGHDYWFSRNGHGVGFWDRGLGDIGDRLHEACEYDERYVWFGNHVEFGNAHFIHYE